MFIYEAVNSCMIFYQISIQLVIQLVSFHHVWLPFYPIDIGIRFPSLLLCRSYSACMYVYSAAAINLEILPNLQEIHLLKSIYMCIYINKDYLISMCIFLQCRSFRTFHETGPAFLYCDLLVNVV